MAAGKRKFPWVFDTFATANDLAEALSAEDQERRRLAKQAHETLEHLHKGFAFYLPDFEKLLDRVLYVGLTCNMKQDVAKLLRAVGIPDGIAACMPELKAEDTISASKTATYMSERTTKSLLPGLSWTTVLLCLRKVTMHCLTNSYARLYPEVSEPLWPWKL